MEKNKVIMKKFQRWSYRKVQNFVYFDDEKLKVIENDGESFWDGDDQGEFSSIGANQII
jgi:hypothetical protein